MAFWGEKIHFVEFWSRKELISVARFKIKRTSCLTVTVSVVLEALKKKKTLR